MYTIINVGRIIACGQCRDARRLLQFRNNFHSANGIKPIAQKTMAAKKRKVAKKKAAPKRKATKRKAPKAKARRRS